MDLLVNGVREGVESLDRAGDDIGPVPVVGESQVPVVGESQVPAAGGGDQLGGG